ncbi:MAG: pYEATS domain-containing protein [Candidatus Sulfotelmatobacter sp.]|jgi:hypothetical protein
MLPIFLALVAGGYIKKFKAPGFEFEPGLQNLPYYPQSQSRIPGGTLPDLGDAELDFGMSRVSKEVETILVGQSKDNWILSRGQEYIKNHDLFLVHVCKPSAITGQTYDVRIFLIRHRKGPLPNQKEGFEDIAKAEFFFGDSWGNKVFPAKNEGSFIGVSTSAWGTFLATCRVTFRNPDERPIIIHRYIDFEMAPALA